MDGEQRDLRRNVTSGRSEILLARGSLGRRYHESQSRAVGSEEVMGASLSLYQRPRGFESVTATTQRCVIFQGSRP